MLQPLNINSTDRVLVLAPHPDDECIGAGGLLVMFPSQCEVVVFTDGCHGNATLSQTQEKNIRTKQFLKGMKYCGISHFKMLALPDQELYENPKCMSDIKLEKYDKIFLSHNNDGHIDHVSLFRHVMRSLSSRVQKIPDIYTYEVHVAMQHPSHYLDITNIINQKRSIISCHVDQISQFDYASQAIALAKYRACQNNRPRCYYEVYKKINIISGLLLTNDITNRILYHKAMRRYMILLMWKMIDLYDINIGKYLKETYMFSAVSIYGYSDIGNLVERELVNAGIIVVDRIDRDTNIKGTVSLVNATKNVDAVIVAVLYDKNRIKTYLKENGFDNVVLFEELIEKLYNENK